MVDLGGGIGKVTIGTLGKIAGALGVVAGANNLAQSTINTWEKTRDALDESVILAALTFLAEGSTAAKDVISLVPGGGYAVAVTRVIVDEIEKNVLSGANKAWDALRIKRQAFLAPYYQALAILKQDWDNQRTELQDLVFSGATDTEIRNKINEFSNHNKTELVNFLASLREEILEHGRGPLGFRTNYVGRDDLLAELDSIESLYEKFAGEKSLERLVEISVDNLRKEEEKLLAEIQSDVAKVQNEIKNQMELVFNSGDEVKTIEDYEFPEDIAKTDDAEAPLELAELEEKKRKDEKDADKLIDDTKNEVKTDETRTLEANFYERTLARTDVDIFFLADNTGSMGGVIASVIKNAQAILDGLRADLKDDPRFTKGSTKVNAQFGVGSYQDDPREPGTNSSVTGKNGHDASYWLHQPMTNNDQEVIAALKKWDAWGGNGYIEEGNFYAIHQAITQGKAVRGDDKLESGHKTGWRKDAAKIIVVFGDRMSWQTSVNEKELKELARTEEVKIIFIDTHEMNNATSRSGAYDSHTSSQMQDAAVEIADASDGIYMKLDDLSKMKEAIVDSVFDALADNT